MPKTCRSGFKLMGNRCIRVKAAGTTQKVSAPRTGPGFTSGGIPIAKIDTGKQTTEQKKGLLSGIKKSAEAGGRTTQIVGARDAARARQGLPSDLDDLSRKFGATSIERGTTLPGAVSGADKLEKFKKAGLHPATGAISFGGMKNVDRGAQTPEGFEHLGSSAPSIGLKEDPKDFQIRVANWERDQATKQANAIAKTTTQIRGRAETEQIKEREELFQEKATTPGGIGGLGSRLNPAFTALTTEEKRFNATLPEAEQIQERIETTEADLTPAQREARKSGINVRVTDEAREGIVDAAQVNTFIDPVTGKTKVGDTAAHLHQVKQLLGAEAGDRVEMNDDGTYFLKDEEGEDVDPIKRAEDRVLKEETEAREKLDDAFRVSSDRIKNQHRTPDGGITDQGKGAMQKLQTKYNKANDELTEDAADVLEKAINKEKTRQIDVETQLEAIKGGKTLSFAEEVSKTKVNRLNELKKQGVDPMVALAQVEREYSLMKSDPEKIKLNEFISGLDRSGIPMEDQFARVYAAAGNNADTAYNSMKTRYGEFQAKTMRDEFLAQNGWGEKQIERKNVKATVNDFWNGEVTDPDAVGNFMDQLEDLGYSDDFKRKQLGAMIISPTLSEGVKDEARALLKEDFKEDAAETVAQQEARFLAGDMEPEEATSFLKRKALLEDGEISAASSLGRKQSGLLRVKTGRITNKNMEAMEKRALKEGWIDEFEEAVALGKPISDTAAIRFNVPEVTTAGELDAIIKVRELKGGGNRKYQADKKVPENLASVLDEKRNAQAMIDKYNELVEEAGARPFEGIGDKGARQASRAWQALGGKPSKELRIYNELEALSGEILSEYIKRISGAAVSEQEAQRLAKNKPNINMNSLQFEDQMKRYLADIEDTINEKITTYGFVDGEEMDKAVRGGFIDYTPEEVENFLGGGDTAQETELLDLIGEAEAGGQYNAVFGDANQADIDFTQKTLIEVGKWQDDFVSGGSPSSAIGKYQFLRGTLRGLQKEMGLTGEEKFTPELQDQMAIKLLERRGWNEFLEGKIDMEELQRRLSQEWASLPTDASDKSFFAGDKLNRASVTTETLRKTLNT